MPISRRVIEIRATPEEVFAYMDDILNVGWHMSGRSMPLMGGRLHLERVSEHSTGMGAPYRWHGKVLGLKVDFAEVVTKRILNKEKVWRTIEGARIIIMSQYEMRLSLSATDTGTLVTFRIDYELPDSFLGKIVGKLLARRYSEWCLRSVCEDAKKALESGRRAESHAVHEQITAAASLHGA